MPYFINGACYQDAEVLTAFESQYPFFSGGAIDYVTASNFAGGLLTATIDHHDLLTNAITTNNINFNPALCDPLIFVSPILTASEIVELWGWGFASIVMVFFWGFVIYSAIEAIKKL